MKIQLDSKNGWGNTRIPHWSQSNSFSGLMTLSEMARWEQGWLKVQVPQPRDTDIREDDLGVGGGGSGAGGEGRFWLNRAEGRTTGGEGAQWGGKVTVQVLHANWTTPSNQRAVQRGLDLRRNGTNPNLAFKRKSYETKGKAVEDNNRFGQRGASRCGWEWDG